VIKPAEDTPLSAIYLWQLAENTSILNGVINVIIGYGEIAITGTVEPQGLEADGFYRLA